MAQKVLDGVKISALDSKSTLSGSEYIVLADGTENYKASANKFGAVVANNLNLTASVKDVYTSTEPEASVNIVGSELQFSFGIPAGDKGDNGRDGADGADGSDGTSGRSARTMYARTSNSSTKPQLTATGRKSVNPGSNWSLAMPSISGTQILWGINGLINPDGTLYLDPSLPEDQQGWQGPYQITGNEGSSATATQANYYVYVYKCTDNDATAPAAPTNDDPNNPNNGWSRTISSTEGIWWKCIGLVNGETNKVISWDGVVRMSGIDGASGGTGDPGEKGGKGDAGNYVEFRFARSSSYDSYPTLDKTARDPQVKVTASNGVDYYHWTESVPPVMAGNVLWMTKATINGNTNALIDEWEDPWYITGTAGESGIPGVTYDQRYCVGTADSYTGTYNDTVANTAPTELTGGKYGWYMDVPDLTADSEYDTIWLIQARTIYDPDKNIYRFADSSCKWSAPVKMSGTIVAEPASLQYILYPMGQYTAGVEYYVDYSSAADGLTGGGIPRVPYVWDSTDGELYYLSNMSYIKNNPWVGSESLNIRPALSTDWSKIDSMDALCVSNLIAANALVGSAVFNNNWMFSQQGLVSDDNYTEVSNKFWKIKVEDNLDSGNNFYDKANTPFKPAMAFDFYHGEAFFAYGDIRLRARDSDGNSNSSITLKNAPYVTMIDRTGFYYGPESGSALQQGLTEFQVSGDGFHVYVSNDSNNNGMYLNITGTQLTAGMQTLTGNGSMAVNGLILNPDGSGSLAQNNIHWDSSGNLTFPNQFFLEGFVTKLDTNSSNQVYQTVEIPTLSNNDQFQRVIYNAISPHSIHIVSNEKINTLVIKEWVGYNDSMSFNYTSPIRVYWNSEPSTQTLDSYSFWLSVNMDIAWLLTATKQNNKLTLKCYPLMYMTALG